MQLAPSPRASALRGRLGVAACMLLASAVPDLARADAGPATQLDATALIYGERGRAAVFEPTARITRIFPDGQSLSAQLGLDVITGASPSGAAPSGRTQTTTSASGRIATVAGNQIPLSAFNDTRGAFDAEWVKPLGRLTSTLGGHFSREKDYQSLGASAQLSLEMMQRLTTLTLGGGVNHDGVFPIGGTPAGMSDGTARISMGSNPKEVTTGMIGVSRILTRRWLVGLNASRTRERGYLTEPYKVLSLVDGTTGLATGQRTERRPAVRERRSVVANSAYHLSRDVLHLSYRYYWDDWSLRSHTLDASDRIALPNDSYLEPHVRFYSQRAARFFRSELVDGAPLPEFASSDYRLGPLKTFTVGAGYGFRLPSLAGEWSVRAEYIGQFGRGHPPDAVGIQREFDLYPPLNIGSLVVGYSLPF